VGLGLGATSGGRVILTLRSASSISIASLGLLRAQVGLRLEAGQVAGAVGMVEAFGIGATGRRPKGMPESVTARLAEPPKVMTNALFQTSGDELR